MRRHHVLVAGASGVVGSAAMRHFAERADTRVTAISRRPPLETSRAEHIPVDLLDSAACRALAHRAPGVTHLVYAALHERPGLVAGWLEAEQIETNARMLRHLIEALDAASALEHVTLLQGTKAYGAHVRPIPLPAREDRDELRSVDNFYWSQEDYLRERARMRGWSFSIVRPQLTFGLCVGGAMNLYAAIGAYAAIAKARGEPLSYPGGRAPVLEATDAGLLARAIDWAAGEASAHGEAFNVTNGDVFTWQAVWPAIADALGMEVGPPVPQRLGESMGSAGPAWDAVREHHGLRAPALAAFVGESFH